MTENVGVLWSDQSFLRNVQYRTDGNLAARQSIYAYRQPRIELPAAVLAALRLTGSEIVTDVGCGNGSYLAELARRDHRGPMIGVDLSQGMLAASRTRAPDARLLAGDATALPLRAGASDLTLAMHMLYHVPEPTEAVSELRRVTRAGGQVVIGLNGEDHLKELREIVNNALPELGYATTDLVGERVRLDQSEEILVGFIRIRTHAGCLICT
ncbi:MAG TPA: methyltransferase domain-containing protein [Streptosporangiaceae bacterium]|nr:methyltransferase domain-containing protein [Streptosporangiaceae bacterium]